MSIYANSMAVAIQTGRVKEAFRVQLEAGYNEVMEAERKMFLKQYRENPDNIKKNYGHGYEKKYYESDYGKLLLSRPRDRNGEFFPSVIEPYARRVCDSLDCDIISLHKHGLSNQEVCDIMYEMLNKKFSKQYVSEVVKEYYMPRLEEFHNKQLASEYSNVYLDAIYVYCRLDDGTYVKRPVHIIYGIKADGTEETLALDIFKTETAENYKAMLIRCKERGLKKVLCFTSDGLNGMNTMLAELFPYSDFQRCTIHISRSLRDAVEPGQKKKIEKEFSDVLNSETAEIAFEKLKKLIQRSTRDYNMKTYNIINNCVDNLFTYFKYPKEIQRTVRTSNVIERLNRHVRRNAHKKELFPNKKSLEIYVFAITETYQKDKSKVHRGYGKVHNVLQAMLDAMPEA